MVRHNLGWSEPVSNFGRLQLAVFYMMYGYKFRERMDRATRPLIYLSVTDFPEHLRERAKRVKSVRGRVARKVGSHTYFAFERMTPKERKDFAKDLLTLFSACALDTGKLKWSEIVYPTDKKSLVEID